MNKRPFTFLSLIFATTLMATNISFAFEPENSQDSFSAFKEDFDRSMQNWFEFYAPGRQMCNFARMMTFMAMDVTHANNFYSIDVDVPGVEKKDITITIKDKLLTVSANRKVAVSKKEKGVMLQRRFSGQTSRSVKLPYADEQGKFTANLDKGVLRIIVPISKVSRNAMEIKINE